MLTVCRYQQFHLKQHSSDCENCCQIDALTNETGYDPNYKWPTGVDFREPGRANGLQHAAARKKSVSPTEERIAEWKRSEV